MEKNKAINSNLLLKFKSRWEKFSLQEKILLSIFHFILVLFGIWVLLPIVFLIINSFKNIIEYNDNAVSLPTHLHFQNYISALSLTYRNTNLIRMALNSILYSITFSLGNIFSSLMVAYALTRYKFRGKDFLSAFAIIVQMIPIYGSETAGYELCYKLGLIDNFSMLWVSGASGFDYTYLLAASYFRIISWEYADAAFIDGASNWYVFIKIMIPMILPPILVLWFNNMVSLWNDYLTPIMYLPNNPTLSSGIYNLKNLSSFLKGGMVTYFAGIVTAFVPVSILFIWIQNKILNIKFEGGLKS